MTDMLRSVEPKSNQLNFDDFVAGQTKTIKITKVSGVAGEQPIAINYEGDNGKPYMPCKSMRRVLVHCWGADGHAYVGRTLTLYGDPTVKFGGLAVGGIRISHMSDIQEQVTMALTATKASRKPFTVKPLAAQPQNAQTIDEELEGLKQRARDAAAGGNEAFNEWFKKLSKAYQAKLVPIGAELRKIANEVDEKQQPEEKAV